ncbi:hypothetical protein ACJJTC_007934 [Scirpophaga incertulas]
MSNTVITNYTDLNGPSTKADSSVVVIVNKDGSLSVDQNLLGTLMGTDGTQAAGISVVRVGHEGRPEDATDSETEDDKVPHVTLSVDSYYDEPNSIIKYDSGAEMLQSLRIETRENSLIGFQNDHCYTSFTSPIQSRPQTSDSYSGYDEPIIEITHTPPPKPIPTSKKITILEEQVIPKGKKIQLKPSEVPLILKGKDVLRKPLPIVVKSKKTSDPEKSETPKSDTTSESSSISSGDSIPDRDSDSDYKETKDKSVSLKIKKPKLKPRILKNVSATKPPKLDPKIASRLKTAKVLLKKDTKEKPANKSTSDRKSSGDIDIETLIPTSEISLGAASNNEASKNLTKTIAKPQKKEKKTPSHVTALLSDMTSLFSTPDVIRRISTDKPVKSENDTNIDKKVVSSVKTLDSFSEIKVAENIKLENETNLEKSKHNNTSSKNIKQKDKLNMSTDKAKGCELTATIPQLDEASFAQILQDTSGITTNPLKSQANIATGSNINSPSLAGPLSPTLDLLGGLQPEEEGLTEDLLMHVAQLVESSENLQEVIDKQVLGKVDPTPIKTSVENYQQNPTNNVYSQPAPKSARNVSIRKDPIEIVRRDGRVITLPPIEAPATRASKRKSQIEANTSVDTVPTPVPELVPPPVNSPEPHVLAVSKQYINKKLASKKEEAPPQVLDKVMVESQENCTSEDDPYRLWCICKQPHNNRFMICCDGCEDWFHGKCVNITKAMGQQMEEQGIEWRCPNCIKKTKATPPKILNKNAPVQKNIEGETVSTSHIVGKDSPSKTSCIVCKKAARATSIYCSDACILKHAQDSLSSQPSPGRADTDSDKPQTKLKSDSRIIVYERKTKRLLAGPNAPTAENLKAWLQKNPTFEVIRPGALSAIKPNTTKRKLSNEPNKVQTTLNFERIPRKSNPEQPTIIKPQSDTKTKNVDVKTPKIKSDVTAKLPESKTKTPSDLKQKTLLLEKTQKLTPKEDAKVIPQPKTPIATRSHPAQHPDTPKASTAAKMTNEPRKLVRSASKPQAANDKTPSSPSPSTSRRKDNLEPSRRKLDSSEIIRKNVRKALQEQLTQRMAENAGRTKFSDDEIKQFSHDTEFQLHELFRDVGMKYKAKYRSLMFNIKDRKNLSLWQKICDRSITPKQLVRLSPEELASQELAEWRDQEAKHQLELIKKSELDLLAASKTYVLKTHKGEEVMETKESVSTELDPNVPVEDLVTALNDTPVDEIKEIELDISKNDSRSKKNSSNRKKRKEDSNINEYNKKEKRTSRRNSDSKKSKLSKHKSDLKERQSKERRTRRSEKRISRNKSKSRDRSEESKDKCSDHSQHRSRSSDHSNHRSRSIDHSRHRSSSRGKSKRRSKSRELSRSHSHSRDRSHSRGRRKRRSPSPGGSKHRHRSKHLSSTEEKHKYRSRSQDNVYNKVKNDSTDSDSIERPKSAMLKDMHPEYDPHEPMITSAFSEEDLRKSREDIYEDYTSEVTTFDSNIYDSSKSFMIDSSVLIPSPEYSSKPEKSSEPESDQEPSSTVDNSTSIVWNGCINMVDVARFYVAALEVSGSATDLEEDLSAELDIVGRINPDTVWDYITKMKRASNKDIVILKLQAANDEEKMQYIALYSYLSSRNRLGVVKVSSTTSVKDFYIVPLPANTAVPAVLLPFDGPGLGNVKTHLLIAIVIRQRKKRPAAHLPNEVLPAKVARGSRKKSYTPPIVNKSSYTPPTSPRRRTALPLPAYTSPALSSSVKDKIAASLAAADEEEAYSPGSSSSSGSIPASALQPTSNTLRTKMEELNRQIEEQKQQILKMTRTDSSVDGEDEAYSPSRPMTPPPVVPLADIALPSNLQEILATIKQRSEPGPADVDMRTLPP